MGPPPPPPAPPGEPAEPPREEAARPTNTLGSWILGGVVIALLAVPMVTQDAIQNAGDTVYLLGTVGSLVSVAVGGTLLWLGFRAQEAEKRAAANAKSGQAVEPTARTESGPRTTCPRCKQHARSRSGWCLDCTSALGRAPQIAAGHTLHQLAACMTRRDHEGALGLFHPEHVGHSWRRAKPTHGLGAVRRSQLRGRLLFGDLACTAELVVPDPNDPGLVWARLRYEGHVRFTGSPTRQRCVIACRTTGGRLVEGWQHAFWSAPAGQDPAAAA